MDLNVNYLIHQGISNLRANGKNYYVFKYDLKKLHTLSQIKTFVKYKIEKIPGYTERLYNLNIKFDKLATNNGWMFSRETKHENIDKFDDSYSYLVDSNVNIDELKARYVELYVLEKPRRIVVGASKNNLNDCLFNAILKAFNFNTNLLPQGFQRPSSLKSKLGLKRDEKIPVELFPKVEELYNVSFIINGEATYTSDIIRKQNICLTIKNGHVEVRQNESEVKPFFRFKEVKPENIIVIYFDADEIVKYDGICKETISIDEYEQLKKDAQKMIVKCDSLENMSECHENYIKKADILKKETKGLVNFYRSQYNGSIAFDVFRKFTKFIKDPEALDEVEHQILDNAFHGGIHYEKKGEYKNCYDYDMNSMYCHFMRKSSFIFPATKPTYKQMTNEELNKLEFLPYGLYNVLIKTHHELWRMKNKGWFTHYDLQIAKMLNIKFELNENKTNVLLYSSKDCIRGNKAFSEFVEYFTNLENSTNKDYVKPIRNALWGYLSSNNATRKRVKNSENIDVDGYLIKEFQSGKNTSTIKMVNKTDIFKYPWARCSIFLTAYCRFQMMKIILDCDKIENIVCINTDGFVSKTKQDLKISNEIGDFKIKQYGNCTINDSNHVVFHTPQAVQE